MVRRAASETAKRVVSGRRSDRTRVAPTMVGEYHCVVMCEYSIDFGTLGI